MEDKPANPTLALDLVEEVLGLGSDAVRGGDSTVKIAFHCYCTAHDKDVRTRALNLIDQLYEAGAYGVTQRLDALEER